MQPRRHPSGKPTRAFRAPKPIDSGPLSCKAEVAFISDYLSSDLDPQTARLFDDHLESCRDCAAFLKTYKKTIDLTRELFGRPAERVESGTALSRLRHPSGKRISFFPSGV